MRGLLLAVLIFTACRAEERPAIHDAAMRETLKTMRTAIAHFHDDNGRYPHALEELVPRYLPSVPADPVTTSAKTWRMKTEETVQPSADFSSATVAPSKPQILDVHSGAPGADSSGKPWSDY